MTRIAPVNLAYNPKTLWFDAGDMEISPDDHVVVTTARGVEFGTMAGEVFEGSDEDIAALKSPLKKVNRVATDEDIARAEELETKSRDAMAVFRELAAKHNENMHPVAVEYLLEGDKAVFYFEAEERLDFREIVRELASRFGVRIDMRQIGVRDEARMIGGIGHCGQELCCKRLGGEFCPVSIRMAKEQNLSLNPQKISGLCGRLMCCLRYEYDAYKDFHSRAPKQNATIQTPDGPAKVASLNVPKEVVDLKIEIDGKMKTVHVPLSDMEPPEEEGARPRAVGEEAWRSAIEPPIASAAAAMFLTSQFTESDKLGDARAVRRNNANVKNVTGSTSMVELPKKGASKQRRMRSSSSEATKNTTSTMRVRRRRSTTVSADGSKTTTEVKDSKAHALERLADDEISKSSARSSRHRRSRGSSRRSNQENSAALEQSVESSVRPGQKSSALSQARDESERSKEGASRRRPRRRHRSRKSNTDQEGNINQEGGINEA